MLQSERDLTPPAPLILKNPDLTRLFLEPCFFKNKNTRTFSRVSKRHPMGIFTYSYQSLQICSLWPIS